MAAPSLNTIEGQYALQVKEFRDRTDRMRSTTRKMWRDQAGFRESFEATWVDWPASARRSLLEPCHKRLNDSLPPPFPKSKALLDLSCPELTDERLVTDTGLTVVQFIDLVVNDQENSDANPLKKLIATNITSFIKSVDGNVYPSFAGHRQRDPWTLSLLYEQRSMWIANFALNAVAEMANIFHEVESQQQKEEAAAAAPAPVSSSASGATAAGGQGGDTPLSEIDPTRCLSCGAEKKDLQTCSQCKIARFCHRDCQRAVWPKHKLICRKP
jgi:hypothetical protein